MNRPLVFSVSSFVQGLFAISGAWILFSAFSLSVLHASAAIPVQILVDCLVQGPFTSLPSPPPPEGSIHARAQTPVASLQVPVRVD